MVNPGFRTHASGLIVPEEHSRQREVFTRDEVRLIERAVKLLASRSVAVFFGCEEDTCRKSPIERIRHSDGGLILRCNHKDRVLMRSF